MPPSRRPQGRSKQPKPRSRQTSAPQSRREEPKPRHQLKLTRRAAWLGFVALLLAWSYVTSLHTWWTQRAEIQTKKAEIAQLKKDIDTIEYEFDRWRDSAYIEAQARQRFGWVMPGEVGYKVIGLDGEVKGATTSLSNPGDAQGSSWYSRMWGSISWAGKPESERNSQLDGPSPEIVLDGK